MKGYYHPHRQSGFRRIIIVALYWFVVVGNGYSQGKPPKASDDFVITTTSTSIKVNALNNDNTGNCPRIPTIIKQPSNGRATNVNDLVHYEPKTGVAGLDSLTYGLCKNPDGSYQTTAKVYIGVYRSIPATYTICKGQSLTIKLDNLNGISYLWYNSDAAGAKPISATPSNTLTVTAAGTLWAEMRIKGQPATPRIKITVTENARLAKASIVVAGGNGVGAGNYTYSVNMGGEPSGNLGYVWRVDGAQVSTAASWSSSWTNSDEKLITVEVTDRISKCSTTLSTAHHRLPDDVDNARCFVEPPVMDWTIQEVANTDTKTKIRGYEPPVIGDIDDDGIPEILFVGEKMDKLLIYKGNDLSKPSKTLTVSLPGLAFGLGTVRTKISSGKSKVLIVIYTDNDGYLRAYDINGNIEWTSSVPYVKLMIGIAFNFADFNRDGYAEIYIGNAIFDAATGKLLCQGKGNVGASSMYYRNISHITAVGDVLGNGELQLVAGNQVYRVNITNRNGTAGNSMTLVKQLPDFKMENGANAPADGTTIIADMNRDGRLDVIVRKCLFKNGESMYLYVWTPSLDNNGRLLARKIVPNIATAGFPLIGDIDGDKYPEIVILSGVATADRHHANDSIYAFKYIPGQTVLGKKWGLSHNDASGFTGLTLFDFNQDGMSELVYRDNYNLRIINGSLKSHITGRDTAVYDLSPPIACQSGTAAEYPVVADIDADGHAEIITIGTKTNKAQPPWIESGPIRVFKGADNTPWANARKVWNQGGFNPAYINDDLTVPLNPISPATFFPGKDGKLGTADDIQPYNSFLQQQSSLNANGSLHWPVPDVKFAGAPEATYYGYGDSAVISLELTNIGSNTLESPFHISVYRNTASVANKIQTVAYPRTLAAASTIRVQIPVPRFSSYGSLSKIVIRANDKGDLKHVHEECDYSNNAFEMTLNMPKTVNDVVAMLTNGQEITVNVKQNDAIPSVCSSPAPSITVAPAHGKAKVVNGAVAYSPDNGYYGVDSLVYRFDCASGGVVYGAEARVYVVVNKATAASYFACTGKQAVMGFESIKDVEYFWYSRSTGSSTVASNTRNCTAPSEWLVTPRFRGKVVFPELKLVLNAYPSSLYNYPDIRLSACPDAGDINLSKYIDTLKLTSIQWANVSPGVAINPSSGIVSTNGLNASARVYTLSYTASNVCVSNVKRTVYLEMIPSGRTHPPKDTIVICHKQAENININAILGIEARGKWSYMSKSPHDVDKYVTQSASSSYGGALIMNGKAIYESPIGYHAFRGISNAKKVEFTFESDVNSCLKGEKFKIVIMLLN
jgi:hypothetical protein